MPDFTDAQNITQTDAALKRVGRAQSVIDALDGQRLTKAEVADATDISTPTVKRILPELQRYGIISKTRRSANRREWLYTVADADEIESLKADLLADPPAAD